MSHAGGLVRLALLGALCGAATAAAEPHRYTVEVGADLARLTVAACFSAAPGALVARAAAAARYLRWARVADDGRSLRMSNGRLILAPEDDCIDYEVDLAAAAAGNRLHGGLDGRSRVVEIPAWLWLPEASGAAGVEVAFELPDGIQVSVPWQALPAAGNARPRFRIPDSPHSDAAVSAFGHLLRCDVATRGTRLRVALLSGRQPAQAVELYAWLARAAANVALTYGRFPNPGPQVVLVPVARRRGDPGEPVPFGHVIRDGGEAVQFYINQQRARADFNADWTATHEFAHLLIPYIDGAENWISEGLASYYQNVLMARGGAYTEAQAWRRIVQGFRRGERAVPHLTLQQAMPVGGWDGIMKTYWGGAAIFFLADVELRQASDNRHSLDSVLAELQACCLPSVRHWSGREFMRKLDSLAPFALFERYYDRHRDARAFPVYGDTLARLGIRLLDDRAVLDPNAERADLREAIMAQPAPEAPLATACAPAG